MVWHKHCTYNNSEIVIIHSESYFHLVYPGCTINKVFPTKHIMISCPTQLIMLNKTNNRSMVQGI